MIVELAACDRERINAELAAVREMLKAGREFTPLSAERYETRSK